jgi:hypothetical protein
MTLNSIVKFAGVVLLVACFTQAAEARKSKHHRHAKAKHTKHRAVASAKKKKHVSYPKAKPCTDPHVATTSAYYTPRVRDLCPTSTPCDRFKAEVKWQGSGQLSGGKNLTYLDQILSRGDCDTAIGASGRCLTPYISVAADPCCYAMGDIIEMPAFKGKMITLPNGHTMIHPGYFIVEDKGGMIGGPGRFDFYTGVAGMFNPDNIFGYKGHSNTRLIDTSVCSAHKEFTVIRRGKSDLYNDSRLAIETSVRDSMSNMSIASLQASHGGSR